MRFFNQRSQCSFHLLLVIVLSAMVGNHLFAESIAPATIPEPPLEAENAGMAVASNDSSVEATPPKDDSSTSSLFDKPASLPSSTSAQPGNPATNSPVQDESENRFPSTNSTTKNAAPSPEQKPLSSTAAPAPTPSMKVPPPDEPPNMQETPDKMAASAPPAPSENVTLNLINRLVQRGILTKEDAGDLIRQAQDDARNASQQAQIAQQAVTQAAAAQQMAVEAAAPPQSDDQVSVSYVPEIVKSEMKDEIKRDVIAAAQAEGWNQPNIPEWVSKFRPFMDFRFRYEGDYYPSGNNTNWFNDSGTNSVLNGNLINFNSINTSAPYQVVGTTGTWSDQLLSAPPPSYNTTQNRERMRIRFRFGSDINLGDNFTSGFRIGTGQNGSPVSENQTLGAPASQGGYNQGGDFSSYAIWLDRAFVKYELGDNPDKMAALSFGRFDNPFYTPTTIMWANDIGFDGIAAQARYKIAKGFTPFITGGLFPIYNTDLNFSSTQQPKYASYDKYLYAGQVGIDWRVVKDFNFKGSVGYYYFQNAQGQVSPQTDVNAAQGASQGFATDASRPSFAQKGNTYIELRNIYDKNYGSTNSLTPQSSEYQYYGLATPFQIFSANGRLEYRHWEPFVVSLSGEWDQNMAWNASNINNAGPPESASSANIHGPINNVNSSNVYDGGNNAWIAQLKVGSGALQKRWDWDFGIAYRYVESDAVIDGFCDSDFGGGGTNLKGWSVGGNLALSKNVFIGARWLSANGIAGPTYKADILQLDLNARF
jgi:Putative porin